MSNIDPKVIDRIRKLLNLAKDGGATENEAAVAMERAQSLLQQNNLSMAEIEMGGGAAPEARLKERDKGRANYRWQRWLVSAISEANFIWCGQVVEKRRNRHGYRDMATGYELIGKVSNIVAARMMYEYLLQTVSRMRAEYETQPGNGAAEGALFAEGLANRLAQRILARHYKQLAEQREEAEAKKRDQAARSSHPAAAPTGNALVVVMADYSSREADLNNDMRQGWEPGTTERKRKEGEAKDAARAQREADLIASGVDPEVASWMSHFDWSQERAEAYVKANREREPEKERKRGRTREDRLNDRLYKGAARDGRRAAENVSLDRQLGSDSARRIK